ncbi:MAG: thymidine phosphorylase [Deltaproteobacteria bacterium]|nr:thymidine phosphorylase [Deltaproteobacteria bacterium]MBN2670438.1 thymidine phosphorylase [Deltaproteobacteria bacterium]
MTYRFPKLIKTKRDRGELTADEIRFAIEQYTAGAVPDYQMSALLMAVYFNGLSRLELDAWTDAMLHSGEVLNHDHVTGTKVDKHSTGGVGDKISIPLAPAVAVCGVPVPMISGRGLGHTGGTLDKLESIPGFNVNLSVARAKEVLAKHNLFLIGQTADVAPADKKMYALRDVTGTVESIPLIASSIMSKKLAEGIDALVLDVKFGAGAFMKDFDQAKVLAQTLISIGRGAGKQVHALLTDMNIPLGKTVGNSLEVRESIEVLSGKGPADVRELTIELGAHMVWLGKQATSLDEGREKVTNAIDSGAALDRFAKIIEAHEGNAAVCDNPALLPTAAYREPILAAESGILTHVEPMAVAMAALSVNAGRLKKEDAVDPSTGVELAVQVNDSVQQGEPIAWLHHNGSGNDSAVAHLKEAFRIDDDMTAPPPLIRERIQ